MTPSIDVLAASNPVYVALLQRSFLQGYQESAKRGGELVLILLLPSIVMVSSTLESFKGTNRTTGFAAWLAKSPDAAIRTRARLPSILPFAKRGLGLAVSLSIIERTPDWTFLPGIGALKREPPEWPHSESRGRALTASWRFGYWCGTEKSTASILKGFGVLPS